MRAAGRPAVPLILTALLLLVLAAHVVGWILAWLANPFEPAGPVATVLYRAGQLLAVLAPLLWAGAVLLLSRTDRSRLIGLLVGVLVLAPVPLVIGTA